MNRVYHLYRRPEGATGLRNNWNYANRITDAEGRTLYAGSTPNKFFKTPVMFRNQSGLDTLVFGANRSLAPGAFVTSDNDGREIFRIDLPIAARIRTRASLHLHAGDSGETFEIVPSHVAAKSELTRLVAVLQEEFVLKRDGATIGYTGQFDPEQESDGSGSSPAKQFAGSLLSDVAKIPGNFARLRKGIRQDQQAGQLTIAEQHASPELALTLLVFRAYIYKDLQSPEPSWWQE